MDIVLGAVGGGGGSGDGDSTNTSGHSASAAPLLVTSQNDQVQGATLIVNQPLLNLATTSQTSLSHEDSGPILYDQPNRTSAIDDIRSGVIYAFIFTLFFTFFLILPGIRSEKFPTILCVVPSMLVVSIIVISLFGTTWHVGEAPNISAAYKAFSRDRIQGELNVRIGLDSVNISLRAYRYYVLHGTEGTIVMENAVSLLNSETTRGQGAPLEPREVEPLDDSEANVKEPAMKRAFSGGSQMKPERLLKEKQRRSLASTNDTSSRAQDNTERRKQVAEIEREDGTKTNAGHLWGATQAKPRTRTLVKRLNVDINYNERFYWIDPQQMRLEYHQALERGLPYPILTVVEYLSQDDAGFSWSRQYRSAGYYSTILLWLSLGVCVLMFFLHCAAPQYGIYTMQLLGLLLLFTDFIYALLIPRGKRALVIPFEGHSLRFRFGWNFWLVMIGGLVSLSVGTLISIVDYFKPNFIFTTVLDVNFDRNVNQSRQRHKCPNDTETLEQYDQFLSKKKIEDNHTLMAQKLKYPPFMNTNSIKKTRSFSSETKLDLVAGEKYPKQRIPSKVRAKDVGPNIKLSVTKSEGPYKLDSFDERL